MYYILKISKKAFIKLEDNGDITVVQEPERASKIEKVVDAMKEASRINEDWEANVVRISGMGL